MSEVRAIGARQAVVRRVLIILTLIALGLAVAANLAFVLGLIRTRPQLYGGAEVLFEATRLRDHLPLYTNPLVGAADYGTVPSRFYVCYPPLWSLVLSLVPAQAAELFGRVACTLGWFGGLFGLARIGTGNTRAATIAAAYGAGVWVIANLVTSGRPDGVALALAACGLARTLRLGKADAWATAIFTLAWWVKPNILAIGAGVILATAPADPRSLKRNVAAALTVTLPLVCKLHLWSHGDWLLHFQRSLLQSLRIHQMLFSSFRSGYSSTIRTRRCCTRMSSRFVLDAYMERRKRAGFEPQQIQSRSSETSIGISLSKERSACTSSRRLSWRRPPRKVNGVRNSSRRSLRRSSLESMTSPECRSSSSSRAGDRRGV
mgnify:CR=1 FL=1